MTDQDPVIVDAAAAERSVRLLEVLPPGAADFQTALQRARALILAAESPAVARLFPIFVNASADAIAEFNFVAKAAQKPSIDAVLLELHGAALAAGASLQRVVRSRTGLAWVDGHLASIVRDEEARARRVSVFARGIAGQLAATSGAPPAAVALAGLVALDERIAVVVAKHEEHAARKHEEAERARIARAEAARAARRAAVDDLRRWFASRGHAIFMYNSNPIHGGKYAEEVLSGDDAAAVPVWRVRHAIAARKSHEPAYQCPAWQREWTPEAWQAYTNAITDLRERLSNVSAREFQWGAHGSFMNGSDFAAAALAYEPDNQGVKPSSVRRAIRELQRFEKDYVWRGPTYSGFEIDSEAEDGLAAFESADRRERHATELQESVKAIHAFHDEYDARLAERDKE